jgi:N-acetylneuraminic acid mutarotase
MNHGFSKVLRLSYARIQSVFPSWLNLVLMLMVMPLSSAAADQPTALQFVWKDLPALPETLGLSGAFAGSCGETLVVAGGSNFPNGPPWEGGSKLFTKRAFALHSSDGVWKEIAPLPRPIAHGVSVTTPRGVLCIGGEDHEQVFREVFLLEDAQGEINIRSFPPLPQPVTKACGVLLGDNIYLIGGADAVDSAIASKRVWKLSLTTPTAWQEQPPLPGEGRIFAVAGAIGTDLYVFSGSKLYKNEAQQVTREFLVDAYRYRAADGWKRLADLPHSVTAAPSPAAVTGSELLIFGGDDGSRFTQPKPPHPGFSRAVLSYDALADTWRTAATAPVALVVTPLVPWCGSWVIPSGEVRPAVRSAEVKQVVIERAEGNPDAAR